MSLSFPHDFEKEASFNFRDCEYNIRATVGNGNRLFVEAEDEMTGKIWRNSFDSKYIEEITKKASSFKKFEVFVRMLYNAMESSGESVSIDLYTYEDLEPLMQWKNQNVKAAVKVKNKRYLILTYEGEWDRVQFPLCLKFSNDQSVEALQRTVAKLRRDMKVREPRKWQDMGASANEGFLTRENIEAIEDEVRDLRETLREKDEEIQHLLEHQDASAEETIADLEDKLEKAQIEANASGIKYRKTIARLEANLEDKNAELKKVKDMLVKQRGRYNKLQQDYEKATSARFERNNKRRTPRKTPRSRSRNRSSAPASPYARKSSITRNRSKSSLARSRSKSSLTRSRSKGALARTRSTDRLSARSLSSTRGRSRGKTPRKTPRKAELKSKRSPMRRRSQTPSKGRPRISSRGRSPASSVGRSPRPRFDPTDWVKKKTERNDKRSKPSWGRPSARQNGTKNRSRRKGVESLRASTTSLRSLRQSSRSPMRRSNSNRRTASKASDPKMTKKKLSLARSEPVAGALASHYDASTEIENIDSRLTALQKFLAAAKANSEFT